MGAMEGEVILGIAGLAATGGTAVGLRSLDNRRHLRQLAHDRARNDRADLRIVLDDAASVTRRAMWANQHLLSHFRDGDIDRVVEQGNRVLEMSERVPRVFGFLFPPGGRTARALEAALEKAEVEFVPARADFIAASARLVGVDLDALGPSRRLT